MAKYQPIFETGESLAHRAAKRFMVIFLILLALAAGVVCFNLAINQVPVLKTEYVRSLGLDSNFEGFRILHISDLAGSSIGDQYERWKRLLSSQKWNAVVLSGDMVGSDGNNEPMLSLIHTLMQLNPDAPIFFISGDGDPEPVLSQGGGQVLASWVTEAQNSGAVYLDAPVSVQAGKRKVWFSPAYLYDLDLESSAESIRQQLSSMEAGNQQYGQSGSATYQLLSYRLNVLERAEAACGEMAAEDLQVAVTHIPLENDYIRESIAYADKESVFNFRAVDLLLCGHTCAGQYRLPWLGAIYAEGKGFFPEDEGLTGMNRVNSINMYISPGLSSSSTAPIKLRLFNQPQATILYFTSKIE